MKLVLFSILFVIFFVTCDKNSENPILENELDLTEIRIKERPCETLEYIEKIGYDFDTALDSLTKKYEPILNVLATEGHYSGEGYNIDKEKINVDFSYDNREFRLLTFTDKANIYRILFSGDVIDEKGNHFKHTACED